MVINEEENEVLNELKNNYYNNQRLLKKLVYERIKTDSSNYFYLNDIYYWSKYLCVSVEKLFQILMIESTDIKELTFRKIVRVSSKEYNKTKMKILTSKHKGYIRHLNMNKRNYFNKWRLISEADKTDVNAEDFCTTILSKSKACFRVVYNDASNTKRLSIGKYNNIMLPTEYINTNIKEFDRIIKIAIYKVFNGYNIRYNKPDYDDLFQECRVYLIEMGNWLNKYNKPIIKEVETKYKEKHGKIFYIKIYFHVISYMFNKFKQNRSKVYNDKLEINNDNYYQDSEEDILRNMCDNDTEFNILKTIWIKGMSEETIKLIAKQEEVSSEEIYSILETKKQIYLN